MSVEARLLKIALGLRKAAEAQEQSAVRDALYEVSAVIEQVIFFGTYTPPPHLEARANLGPEVGKMASE